MRECGNELEGFFYIYVFRHSCIYAFQNNMPIRNTDRLLQHLEGNAADELGLLESVGVEYYSSEQLLRLRGQWEVKNALFHIFQRLLIRIAAFTAVWISLGFIQYFLHWNYPAFLMMALVPLSFLLFFGGLIFMRSFFKGKGHLDRVGEMISEELTRRRQAG